MYLQLECKIGMSNIDKKRLSNIKGELLLLLLNSNKR